ncbi:ZrgA family zinc uptake protein [Methylophaga sp.]|uniref:ZrgA family zinc uptake protein n=1 Tax=Methylophaga sp. TaxID=2024840 RepID=UPI003A8EFC24
MKKKVLALALGCVQLFPVFVFAAERIEHESHVHGLVDMTVVIEQDKVNISLDSPAMNMVGFEHKAESEHDVNKVREVEATLKTAPQLFAFKGSRCEVDDMAVDVSGLIASNEHDHENHHADLEAQYQFSCDSTENLSEIDVLLLQKFPAIERINVEWISSNKAGVAKLTQGNSSISLD